MQNLTSNVIQIFGLPWIFQLSSRLTNSFRYDPNTLMLQNFTERKGENINKNLFHANFSIIQIARNKCKINGELIFDAYHSGLLEVRGIIIMIFYQSL